MNGNLVHYLALVITGLLGLVTTLIGLILKQHQKADDEHRATIEAEIQRLRKRLHDLTSMVAIVNARSEDQSRR